MDYLKPVYPNEKVIVKGNPIYFRFNKLKTRVVLSNSKRFGIGQRNTFRDGRK